MQVELGGDALVPATLGTKKLHDQSACLGMERGPSLAEVRFDERRRCLVGKSVRTDDGCRQIPLQEPDAVLLRAKVHIASEMAAIGLCG